MIEFIKRYWIAYLVGAAVAVLLGAAAAHFFGIKASTPMDQREERILAEKENAAFIEELTGQMGSTEPQGSGGEEE